MTSAAAVAESRPKAETFGRSRLEPGMYTVDLKALKALTVQVDGKACDFIGAFCKLRDLGIKKMPAAWGVDENKYETESGDVVVTGEWIVVYLLRRFLELERNGTKPFGDATWFYYDHDRSRDADTAHVFFVLHDGKIGDESFRFFDDDALVLKKKGDDDPIWHSHPYFDAALEAYWYRKFYTETLMGQLMVLRSDAPLLYHYARPTEDDATHAQALTVILAAKTYYLLWIAVAFLAGIAFPSLSLYTGIAAILLTIQLAIVCWRAREVH